MHAASLTPAQQARTGDRSALAAALIDARQHTLSTFADFERALPGLAVPYRAELNPPLWELGHIGWFASYWLARNPERLRGVDADPDVARLPADASSSDRLYDSSRVAHATRWDLPLPDAGGTREALRRQLGTTLELLRDEPDTDAALYFYRLALLHEDMHHEASLYTARSLDVPIVDVRWRPRPLPSATEPITMATAELQLGNPASSGFVFDNEIPPHPVAIEAFAIDAQVLRWAEFLPFADAGGYRDDRLWSDAGRAWRDAARVDAPRYLRRDGPAWQQWRDARWQPLALDEPACHLTRHEAEAWCRWAGRRLPTEAEWERAALADPRFRWGDVWEWTASDFAPYPGFRAHPYRDYSAPWFGGRAVLRGASFLTQPRMRHPRYRNFFEPRRNDIAAGFRTCRV